MFKVTFFFIAINAVLVSCTPIGNWGQSQHLQDSYVSTNHHEVIQKPKDAITSSVTQENVMTVEKPLVNPVSYLPPFIQGLLPQVISQAVGQLVAYLPGFQRYGFYPQQQLGLGLAHPSFVSVYAGLPINLAQGYYPGQAGVLPLQPGVFPQQAGVFPQQVGVLPQQVGVLPQQAGVLPPQAGFPPHQAGIVPHLYGPFA